MISKNEAIDQFRQVIGQKASWLKLMGSQFIEHLAIFVSWALREALWRLERLHQEFFLSTALNRSSILAHVEDREYIPRKRTPASGLMRITNMGTVAMSLPIHTPFLSGSQLDYLTTATVTIQPGLSADVPISQMEKETITLKITQETPFFEHLLSKDQTLRLKAFDVYLNTDGNGYVLWSLRRMFRNAKPTDTVYDEFYSHAGQTGIRFGNGIFGTIPPINTNVKIDLWLTEGETTLLSGQQLSVVGEILDSAGEAIDITAVTIGAVDGGGAEEGLEEIRRNLHYWQIYLDKLIWDDDYAYFLRKMFDNIVWVNVWGEEEQEAASGFNVQNINKIFVSAYAPGNTDLSIDTMNLFADVRLLNRKFQWVAPVFSTFTLAITGKVARTTIIDEARQKIVTALTEAYGKDSPARKDAVYVHEIYRLIEATGYFPTDTGTFFQVVSAGTIQATQLQEMVHIDLAATTITLTYL